MESRLLEGKFVGPAFPERISAVRTIYGLSKSQQREWGFYHQGL